MPVTDVTKFEQSLLYILNQDYQEETGFSLSFSSARVLIIMFFALFPGF